MTLYYKTIFKPYFSQCKNLKNNESVLEVVRDFAQEYQPNLMALLDKLGREMSMRYLDLLKMLVFSHRHHKSDISCNFVDFDTVREPMYKYSRAA